MKINEVTQSQGSTPESNLVTALELIRQRYKDKKQPPKISTQSLINLVLNTDKNFDYDALVSANEKNPALKNLIKSYNKDYVELKSVGDEDSSNSTTTNTDKNAPVDTVSKMAKRAAKNRGANL